MNSFLRHISKCSSSAESRNSCVGTVRTCGPRSSPTHSRSGTEHRKGERVRIYFSVSTIERTMPVAGLSLLLLLLPAVFSSFGNAAGVRVRDFQPSCRTIDWCEGLNSLFASAADMEVKDQWTCPYPWHSQFCADVLAVHKVRNSSDTNCGDFYACKSLYRGKDRAAQAAVKTYGIGINYILREYARRKGCPVSRSVEVCFDDGPLRSGCRAESSCRLPLIRGVPPDFYFALYLTGPALIRALAHSDGNGEVVFEPIIRVPGDYSVEVRLRSTTALLVGNDDVGCPNTTFYTSKKSSCSMTWLAGNPCCAQAPTLRDMEIFPGAFHPQSYEATIHVDEAPTPTRERPTQLVSCLNSTVSALFLGDWRLENGGSSHLTASEEAEGYRKWLQTGAQTKGSGMGALRWIPSTCQLPPWPQVLGETVKTLPYTTVVFLGDSTNIEFGYVVKLMLEWASGRRGTVAVTSGGGFQVKVAPSHTFNSTISYLHQHAQRMHTYYVINNGLWDLCLYGNQRVEQNVDLFFQQIRGRSDVIWRTTLELHFFPWGLIHRC